MVDGRYLQTATTSFDSLNGVVACYYNGFVYPDAGNPFRLPAAFSQYLHDTNASSTNTSTTSTMSMVRLWPIISSMLTAADLNFQSGSRPATPTPRPTGVPLAPGSGGYYNATTVAGTALATLTGGFSLPRPTAPFVNAASRLALGVCAGTTFVVMTGLGIFLAIWVST
ncbi:MAG: hypothetical protein Q9199_006251 [Rusavskia elegans]